MTRKQECYAKLKSGSTLARRFLSTVPLGVSGARLNAKQVQTEPNKERKGRTRTRIKRRARSAQWRPFPAKGEAYELHDGRGGGQKDKRAFAAESINRAEELSAGSFDRLPAYLVGRKLTARYSSVPPPAARRKGLREPEVRVDDSQNVTASLYTGGVRRSARPRLPVRAPPRLC